MKMFLSAYQPKGSNTHDTSPHIDASTAQCEHDKENLSNLEALNSKSFHLANWTLLVTSFDVHCAIDLIQLQKSQALARCFSAVPIMYYDKSARDKIRNHNNTVYQLQSHTRPTRQWGFLCDWDSQRKGINVSINNNHNCIFGKCTCNVIRLMHDVFCVYFICTQQLSDCTVKDETDAKIQLFFFLRSFVVCLLFSHPVFAIIYIVMIFDWVFPWFFCAVVRHALLVKMVMVSAGTSWQLFSLLHSRERIISTWTVIEYL